MGYVLHSKAVKQINGKCVCAQITKNRDRPVQRSLGKGQEQEYPHGGDDHALQTDPGVVADRVGIRTVEHVCIELPAAAQIKGKDGSGAKNGQKMVFCYF